MQTKWLHLQSATMDLDVLQQFVMECHLIGDDVKTVTIELVKRAGENYLRHSEAGRYIEPGSVLRAIGNYSPQNSLSLSQKARPTVPVVFVASPYLRLRPLKGHQNGENRGDHLPRTLLQNLYGFDVTPNRDKTQIVRKGGNGSQLNSALHVNQMWCLIGSSILITMSDHTTKELLDGTIGERSLGHEPPIKVKVIEDKQKHHDIAVSSSITWVDLFKITMDAVQKKRSDFHYYDLRDENKVVITAERWIEIASSRSLRKTQVYTFYLTPRPKNGDPSKDRLFLEYRRHDASGILDELPTKHRPTDASSELLGSSMKESYTHESAHQLTSNTASSPLFLYQDGTDFIVSSPDPQDPDELYDTDKDPLSIIPQSHESGLDESTNTTTPLGIDNSPNDREAPEASSTGNFTNLNDDIAGNMTDDDGTIDLSEAKKHQMYHKRIRHKKIQPGSELSVETFPSAQEDDPNASNDIFLKQLFIHKQRQSQSQGSIASLVSKHFPGANAGSFSSRRDSLRTYHTHQYLES
ncbi:hypothetical protein TsFJ059_010053 [Trichoderma semiorbis]|uniref:Uncharacterized protein n=1 Tax=Trichoderma semiorbis TaxID=1491008 RepID=A0A9P8HQC3_9HYPO|nr:hypothetical protein TsFJ059_010053 [Trichoderma semiorbis]